MDETRQALNEAQPAQWCDRCQSVHPARAAGGYDRMISASAKNLADAIDAAALEQFKRAHS
jgi:hypothetical protein